MCRIGCIAGRKSARSNGRTACVGGKGMQGGRLASLLQLLRGSSSHALSRLASNVATASAPPQHVATSRRIRGSRTKQTHIRVTRSATYQPGHSSDSRTRSMASASSETRKRRESGIFYFLFASSKFAAKGSRALCLRRRKVCLACLNSRAESSRAAIARVHLQPPPLWRILCCRRLSAAAREKKAAAAATLTCSRRCCCCVAASSWTSWMRDEADGGKSRVRSFSSALARRSAGKSHAGQSSSSSSSSAAAR